MEQQEMFVLYRSEKKIFPVVLLSASNNVLLYFVILLVQSDVSQTFYNRRACMYQHKPVKYTIKQSKYLFYCQGYKLILRCNTEHCIRTKWDLIGERLIQFI